MACNCLYTLDTYLLGNKKSDVPKIHTKEADLMKETHFVLSECDEDGNLN